MMFPFCSVLKRDNDIHICSLADTVPHDFISKIQSLALKHKTPSVWLAPKSCRHYQHLHLSGAAIRPEKFATLHMTLTRWRSAMFNPKFFDEISAKLSELAEKSPAKDIEKNARALLAQGFSKLDLVTREEFDIQTQLLSRTLEKLAELEARVAALETQSK
jgi:hypothetical protein